MCKPINSFTDGHDLLHMTICQQFVINKSSIYVSTKAHSKDIWYVTVMKHPKSSSFFLIHCMSVAFTCCCGPSIDFMFGP